MKKTETVIITGCSSGIGKSLMIKLLQQGYNVIGVCRKPTKVKSFLNHNYSGLQLIKCDLLKLNQLKDLVKKLKKINNINILINNAGSIFPEKKNIFYNMDQTYFLNSFVPFFLTNNLLSNFQKNKNNLVLNIGSNAQKLFPITKHDLNFSSKHMSYKMYCKSKLYLLYLTKSLSLKTSKNINCSYVHPGLVKTNIAKNLSILLKLGFVTTNFIYGITPHQSSEYIIKKILNKKYKNSMYFDFNSKLFPKKIETNKYFLQQIYKKFFLMSHKLKSSK